MKDELAASIRVAMDRGATIESAVQSLINAGYNQQEVHAAEEMIKNGAMNLLYKDEGNVMDTKKSSGQIIEPAKKESLSTLEVQGARKSEGKNKMTYIIIGIVAVLLVLMGVLGYLIYKFVKP